MNIEIGKIYLQNKASDINPKLSGWYDTDKGRLYWFSGETVWSCRGDRVSDEYPMFWYSLQESKAVELSDNEIAHYWKRNNCTGHYLEGLIDGSKWMRDKDKSINEYLKERIKK